MSKQLPDFGTLLNGKLYIRDERGEYPITVEELQALVTRGQLMLKRLGVKPDVRTDALKEALHTALRKVTVLEARLQRETHQIGKDLDELSDGLIKSLDQFNGEGD